MWGRVEKHRQPHYSHYGGSGYSKFLTPVWPYKFICNGILRIKLNPQKFNRILNRFVVYHLWCCCSSEGGREGAKLEIIRYRFVPNERTNGNCKQKFSQLLSCFLHFSYDWTLLKTNFNSSWNKYPFYFYFLLCPTFKSGKRRRILNHGAL